MDLFILGPAGSGKSSFVKAFSTYLQTKTYTTSPVNLDPATPPIYPATKNIRTYVKTEEIMKTFQLGINSALIKSIELSQHHIPHLKTQADYILYDTPGQMELFIYSPHGRNIVNLLRTENTAGIFLIDLSSISDAESFLSAVLQNVIVTLRLSIPTLTVFTKSDLASINITHLKNEIMQKPGVLAELLENVIDFIEYTTIPQRPLMISNITKEGFDEVFSAINELFCSCGDLS